MIIFDTPTNFSLEFYTPPSDVPYTFVELANNKLGVFADTLTKSEIDSVNLSLANFDTSVPVWSETRDKRNILLSDSDWTQLLDAPIDAATQARWATYRQTLRDLPQTYPTPDDVVWPTPPK